MYGNPIHHVYIADGFLDDCEELIHRCLEKQETLDYQSFYLTWQEMNIGCLYQGRTSGAEVAELSEEVLQIAKHYMVANTSNYEESVAGLFLVYSLLNLQPYPGFAALRLVPEDVTAISRLETVARRERRYDVLYILASVLIKGPCHYHAAERERGMEAPIKKYLDGFKSIDSIRGVRPKGVFYRQNEELDIIRELGALTVRYSEAKVAVVGPGPSDRSLQYIDGRLPSELNSSLRKIISGVDDEEDDDRVSDDSEEESPVEHHALVEAIKAKAMRDIVNPMKHLTGIEDRKNQTKNIAKPNQKKSDIKSKPGKIKTNSPTKPQTRSSPKKRKPSPKSNKSKKHKPDVQDKVDEVKTENDDSNTEDDVNLEEFQVEIIPDEKEEELSENEEKDMEELEGANQVDIEIESLPTIFRTEDNGKVYEIEIIDEYGSSHTSQENMKSNISNFNSLPDLSIGSYYPSEDTPQEYPNPEVSGHSSTDKINDDYEKFKNTHDNKPYRNFKKTHLKSKLKRLGMLPVANFEESK